MTYPVTETQLAILRDDLFALRQRNRELEENLRQLRREHDVLNESVVEERDKREHRRLVLGTILMCVVWTINLILFLHSPD